ncbi:hypothetical protein [Tenacibaculum sp. nBUS_03]|uniref:hypothetical protein n=1 Tax=Tenacibaculum sp. nBUS_03 TaxID=3395320 RepID=UPI003EC06F99
MKKVLSFLTILTLIISCSSSKKNFNKNTKEKSNQEPVLVELTLDKKPENFVWNKGDFLNLKGKIKNKSKVPITVLSPKSSYNVNPDYFRVNFLEGFEGTDCIFEVGEDDIRREVNEFITILPNQTKDIFISGRSYFIKYCNQDNSNKEEIKLNLRYNYYEIKHNYNTESYFIKKNYKTKISKEDEQKIQSKIKYIKNSVRMKMMSADKQKKQISKLEKSLRKTMINSTFDEQRLIIEKFNNLFPKKLESNSITIKIKR